MAFTTAFKNEQWDAAGVRVTHLGLATTGVELTGGLYARVAPVWNAAANGQKAATVTFEVPAGAAPNEVLYRNALTAGTDYGSKAFPQESFASAGQLQVTVTWTN